MNCSDCKFSYTDEESSHYSASVIVCRKNPPTISHIDRPASRQEMGNGHYDGRVRWTETSFPEVKPDMWCGEYSIREEKK